MLDVSNAKGDQNNFKLLSYPTDPIAALPGPNQRVGLKKKKAGIMAVLSNTAVYSVLLIAAYMGPFYMIMLVAAAAILLLFV